jgi:hypothetical protein
MKQYVGVSPRGLQDTYSKKTCSGRSMRTHGLLENTWQPPPGKHTLAGDCPLVYDRTWNPQGKTPVLAGATGAGATLENTVRTETLAILVILLNGQHRQMMDKTPVVVVRWSLASLEKQATGRVPTDCFPLLG